MLLSKSRQIFVTISVLLPEFPVEWKGPMLPREQDQFTLMTEMKKGEDMGLLFSRSVLCSELREPNL